MTGNGYKPPSRQAILDLVRRAKRGDEAATVELIEANRRLISKIAWHYRHAATSLTTEDLEQYGVIGLLRALKKFDLKRGHAFSTYATFWIQAEIKRGLQNNDRMIRLPAYLQDRLARERRASPGKRNPYHEPLSLNDARSPHNPQNADHPDDEEIGDLIPDPAAPTEAQAEIGHVLSHLDRLPFRQRRALQMRFIGGFELEEIGDRLGVTRQRAKQLCNEGISRLRQIFGICIPGGLR
jgi:RNA polymerase sigma factor (sigma-70 family)